MWVSFVGFLGFWKRGFRKVLLFIKVISVGVIVLGFLGDFLGFGGV